MNNIRAKYWGSKRYHSLNSHLRELFGSKVMKISLDAGFTCPNRDGNVGRGGCIYCSSRGSGDFAGEKSLSISGQFQSVKAQMEKKWKADKYLAYFQAYSNTYAPVSELRELYNEALKEEGVVGLSIATRPDCLPDDVLELLAQVNEKTYLWIELGLQSMHDRTLDFIRRGHDFKNFKNAVIRLKERGIRVCAHVIFGLPGETREEMLETVRELNRLGVKGVKFHLLYILRGTALAVLYEREPFPLLTQEDYVNLVCDSLELLTPETIVHRLTGDAPIGDLIEPQWSRKKWEVLNAIDAEMERRNSWQGKCDGHSQFTTPHE